MDVSITLTPELLSLIKAKIEYGRFRSTSDVVHEALRLMEQHDHLQSEHLKSLGHAWQEGVAGGDAGILDFADLRSAAREELLASRKE
jgi:antitoxin ParD1/3/4